MQSCGKYCPCYVVWVGQPFHAFLRLEFERIQCHYSVGAIVEVVALELVVVVTWFSVRHWLQASPDVTMGSDSPCSNGVSTSWLPTFTPSLHDVSAATVVVDPPASSGEGTRAPRYCQTSSFRLSAISAIPKTPLAGFHCNCLSNNWRVIQGPLWPPMNLRDLLKSVMGSHHRSKTQCHLAARVCMRADCESTPIISISCRKLKMSCPSISSFWWRWLRDKGVLVIMPQGGAPSNRWHHTQQIRCQRHHFHSVWSPSGRFASHLRLQDGPQHRSCLWRVLVVAICLLDTMRSVTSWPVLCEEFSPMSPQNLDFFPMTASSSPVPQQIAGHKLDLAPGLRVLDEVVGSLLSISG